MTVRVSSGKRSNLPELDANGEPHSGVVWVTDEATIADAVELMIERKVSSVLVCDTNEMITGIVTERDIVRRLTLADVQDKLKHSVATIMTRNLHFAHIDSVYEDVLTLHDEHRIRHFPILKGEEPSIENLVGIISISQFVRQFVIDKKKARQISRAEEAAEAANKPRMAVIAHPSFQQVHKKLFEGLGLEVVLSDDVNKFFNTYGKEEIGLLFDMDGYAPDLLKAMISTISHYKGKIVFATSVPTFIAPFRAHLKKGRQSIALKPVDLGYVQWYLTAK